MAATPSIRDFHIDFPGHNSAIRPRLGFLRTDVDSLATVSAAGYLNPWILANNITLYGSDAILVAAANGTQIYKVVKDNTGSITLTALG